MKYQVIFFFFIGIYLPINSIYSQSNDSSRYFPFNSGNTWRWYDNNNGTTFDNYISKDSLLPNGSRLIYEFGGTSPKWRIDTNKNVYQYISPSQPELWFKLNAQNGDTFLTMSNSYKVVISIYPAVLFGQPTTIKQHTWYINGSNTWWACQQLAYGFGMIRTECDMGPVNSYVTGCMIDSIRYGSMVDIKEHTFKSDNFSLKQNYPNPFNPTTTIEFDISVRTFISLKIYNSLGQHISTLIQKELSAGNHKIVWDGKIYSSGIYFYTLQAGSFSQTKKLLLIK